MRIIKQQLCVAILLAITTQTNAQLGGILKKAKDKITTTSPAQATTPTNKTPIMDKTKEATTALGAMKEAYTKSAATMQSFNDASESTKQFHGQV